LPHLLGHEASGTVIAVGPGVKHAKPEDKVVLHWRKGLGIEATPPTYQWQGKKVNAVGLPRLMNTRLSLKIE